MQLKLACQRTHFPSLRLILWRPGCVRHVALHFLSVIVERCEDLVAEFLLGLRHEVGRDDVYINCIKINLSTFYCGLLQFICPLCDLVEHVGIKLVVGLLVAHCAMPHLLNELDG